MNLQITMHFSGQCAAKLALQTIQKSTGAGDDHHTDKHCNDRNQGTSFIASDIPQGNLP
jgi:hypothetical protein